MKAVAPFASASRCRLCQHPANSKIIIHVKALRPHIPTPRWTIVVGVCIVEVLGLVCTLLHGLTFNMP